MQSTTPQQRWAAFVRRAVENAKTDEITSITQIVQGHIGRSTVFRWQNGEWDDYPEIGKVRAFCRATGADLDEAMATLRGGGEPGIQDVARCRPPLICPHCKARRPAAPAGLLVDDLAGIEGLEATTRFTLPPAYHRPAWSRERQQWVCRACAAVAWPCLVAQAHGEHVGLGAI
ncbi:hypothetical protein [Micromonospora maritima]|uniref:hypothetical protein n=1 Tax=Micromonospora maritima TaxID=986711 RepID=UPI00157D5329|nr:hypothetical protein [Micromonospora maritima]